MSTLLVSSVGGHLTQLRRLVPRLQGIDADLRWVTFDTPQSRSMLAEEDVIYLDYTGPRDVRNVLRHALVARRLYRGRHSITNVVSTGSGIALSFLPLARMRGVAAHYIESFTRSAGPSLTGRLLSHVPGISLYSQYPGWAEPPWSYAGSVFDAFSPGPHRASLREIERVVVTLGTMEDYQFRRLVERAAAIIPPAAEVLWQVGCTDVGGIGVRAHRELPARTLQSAIEAADVVIAHAGCGSSVSALEAGKMPVLVPREAAARENVDDHQLLLAEELTRRGLAVCCPVEDLSMDQLRTAASGSVLTAPGSAPFLLNR